MGGSDALSRQAERLINTETEIRNPEIGAEGKRSERIVFLTIAGVSGYLSHSCQHKEKWRIFWNATGFLSAVPNRVAVECS